jgi:hypothetical protein
VSKFDKKPRVTRTDGWALSDNLIKNPYQNFYPEEQSLLCAEFRRMVFEDGVPVRPSVAHVPAMIALTEEELRDTSPDSWVSVMNISGTLRQAASEKFTALSQSEPVPSQRVFKISQAQTPRQNPVTLPPPAASPMNHFHMKG